MSAALFKQWLSKSASEFLSDEQIRDVCNRFLLEAAKHAGGERVYVPMQQGEHAERLRWAMKLAGMGLGFDECQDIVGPISRASFYRRKRQESFDFSGVDAAHAKAYRSQCGAEWVYVLGFVGDNDERCVKVGMTGKPAARARTIAQATDFLLAEMAILALPLGLAAGALERKVHEAMREHAIGGEWFAPPGWMDEAVTHLEELGREACGGSVYLYRA